MARSAPVDGFALAYDRSGAGDPEGAKPVPADELLERVELSGLGPRDEICIGSRRAHTRLGLVASPAWKPRSPEGCSVAVELVRRRCGGAPPDQALG